MSEESKKTFFTLLRQNPPKGFTAFELLIAAAISATLLTVAVVMMTNILTNFHHTTLRNQMQNDARMAMSTMIHALQEGNATTAKICSCGNQACAAGCGGPLASYPPYSRIEFNLAKSTPTTNAFYYYNGMAYMNVGGQGPQILARNVTTMTFMNDPLDPTSVSITLRLDAVSDKNQPETVLLSNQVAQMILAQ